MTKRTSNQSLKRIPKCYARAQLRSITPIDSGEVGIAFQDGDKVIRLALAIGAIRQIAHIILCHPDEADKISTQKKPAQEKKPAQPF